MADVPRRYHAGYRDPTMQEWLMGIPDEGLTVELGYLDIEREVWIVGEPDIQSGEWLPDDALLSTGGPDCPSAYPIKGNLPSRIYHLPDQSTYARTTPEICFGSEDTAKMAGFRPSKAPASAT